MDAEQLQETGPAQYVIPGQDDGVEPDVGRELLPQPLVVPQVVRVLVHEKIVSLQNWCICNFNTFNKQEIIKNN